MPGLTLDSFGAWDGSLLTSLPQSTIPATATGLARSDQYVQDYTPTMLLNADGSVAGGNISSTAPPAHGSLLDTILGGVTKVLSATGIRIDASGAGVAVTRAGTLPSTIVNTQSPQRQLLENPFVWAGALLGAWLLWDNRK